jgi:hypothetical protein
MRAETLASVAVPGKEHKLALYSKPLATISFDIRRLRRRSLNHERMAGNDKLNALSSETKERCKTGD